MAERIRRLVSGVGDWDYLVQAAARNCIAPLVYSHLNRLCPAAVPPGHLGRLGQETRGTAANNLLLTNAFLELAPRFEEEGIVAILFKGPHLASTQYGNLALRPFEDLDLLVAAGDFVRARELLLRRGFRSTRVRHPQTFLKFHHADNLVRADGVSVELHGRLVPRYLSFPLDNATLLEQHAWVSIRGTRIRTLAPEVLLLALCIHGTKHRWSRLSWVCDVSELLAHQPGLSMPGFLDRAREVGCERVCLLGLSLASDLLGLPLEQEIRTRIQKDPAVGKLTCEVRGCLLPASSAPTLLELAAFQARVRERPMDRLRYWVRFALSPKLPDSESIPLPPFLFPFYYLIRPVRLAGKYGFELWKAITR